MSRKTLRIGIAGVLGLVSFAAAFWVSKGGSPPPAQAPVIRADSPENMGEGLEYFGTDNPMDPSNPRSLAMKEKELDELIKEVRLKIDSCQRREKQLDKREKSIQMAEGLMKNQAEELEALRVQLVAPMNRIREAMAALENSRIRIRKEEQINIKRIAAVCEKMDSASGSAMLASMCSNNQEEDAVKILRFMSERSAGKILAEMSDKEMAARLCSKLKVIQEES